MAPQTTVSTTMEPGFPGTQRSSTNYMTCINTDTAEIPFGVGVVMDKAAGQLTNRQAAKLPTAAADTFLGVARRSRLTTLQVGTTNSGPKAGVVFNVAYDGELLVKVESAVVKGGRAFMRFAAGAGGTQLGIFRADADTATAVELRGCEFMHSGTAGSLVWMRINDMATRATQT